MPSKSKEQAKTMQAVANGWKPTGSAAKIPVTVAKEYVKADQNKAKVTAKPHVKPRGRG